MPTARTGAVPRALLHDIGVNLPEQAEGSCPAPDKRADQSERRQPISGKQGSQLRNLPPPNICASTPESSSQILGEGTVKVLEP